MIPPGWFLGNREQTNVSRKGSQRLELKYINYCTFLQALLISNNQVEIGLKLGGLRGGEMPFNP